MADPRELLPAGLDRFLLELRARGLTVGSPEIQRLQHTFESAPRLDLGGLETLLACVLVKTDADRVLFAEVFNQWTDRTAGSLQTFAARPVPAADRARSIEPPFPEELDAYLERLAAPPRPQPRPWLRRLARLSALLFALLPAQLDDGPVWRSMPLPPASEQKSESSEQECAGDDTDCPSRSDTGATPATGSTAGSVDTLGLTPRSDADALPESNAIRGDETALAGITTRAVHACEPPPPPELPPRLSPYFGTWQAEVRVFDQPPLLILGLGLLGLGIAGGLWLRFRGYRSVKPLDELREDAPKWLPLLSLPARGPELLAQDDLQRLVWGVERFVAEEAGVDLDVDRSVNETAQSGGLPSLAYEHATHVREVWLWQDEAMDDPTGANLADEIERALTRSGLSVRRGRFADVPDDLIWDEGEALSTRTLEGHRQSALVAIITDGYGMSIARRSRAPRQRLSQLLVSLAQWPRLAFVDCAQGRHGLSRLVEPHGIRCIEPRSLPDFLGTGRGTDLRHPRTPEIPSGDLLAWASSLALSPEPVDDHTAFALRHALGLSIDADRLSELVDIGGAERIGGRLSWNDERRAGLLNWLARAEVDDLAGPGHGLLRSALAFWRDWYRRQLGLRRRQARGLLRWTDSLPERELRMELALLGLWSQPKDATLTLCRLFNGGLRDQVERRLRDLAPTSLAGHLGQPDWKRVIFLPWDERDQTDCTRFLLAQMGFGKSHVANPGELRLNGLLALAIGVCLAASATALSTAVERLVDPQLARDFQQLDSAFAKPEFLALTLNDPPSDPRRGSLRVVRGTPSLPWTRRLGAHAHIELEYGWRVLPNGEWIGDSRLWRAGFSAHPIRACDAARPGLAAGQSAKRWPRRSLLAIAADAADPGALLLAARMLDLGGVDAALVGPDAVAQTGTAFDKSLEDSSAHDQLLVILASERSGDDDAPIDISEFDVSDATLEALSGFKGELAVIGVRDLQSLHDRLAFAGALPLAESWPGLYGLLRGDDTSILVRGGARRAEGPVPGMELVQLCPGTFRMGSEDGEDDEKPSLVVVAGALWMASHETTNREYELAYRPRELDIGIVGELPRIGLNYDESRAFCRHLNQLGNDPDQTLRFDLPSEAQWEYAARAGSSKPWPGADDSDDLEQMAWLDYPGDLPSRPRLQPVMRTRPNLLCIYDMHGNALEQVTDCYARDTYANWAMARRHVLINPTREERGRDCRKRVARGGAYYSAPEHARSAYRTYDYPWSRDSGRGFRCVAVED